MVISIDHPAKEPVEPVASSKTWRFHVPFGERPSKASSPESVVPGAVVALVSKIETSKVPVMGRSRPLLPRSGITAFPAAKVIGPAMLSLPPASIRRSITTAPNSRVISRSSAKVWPVPKGRVTLTSVMISLASTPVNEMGDGNSVTSPLVIVVEPALPHCKGVVFEPERLAPCAPVESNAAKMSKWLWFIV